MTEEINSLYDLHKWCKSRTLRVIYYDFKSKYVINCDKLNESIHDVAESLISLSAENSVVVCLINPCFMLPSILLGILKVSSAFAFLDVHNPIHALENLQKYIPVNTLLVADVLLEELKELCCCWKKKLSKFINDFAYTILQSSKCTNKNCMNSSFEPSNTQLISNLAYVMQTSGTTGDPKIVQVPHQCILPNIIDLKSRFNITSHDVILLCSPLTFDPSIIDIFLSVACGSTLVIIPDQMKSIPRKLTEVIIDSKISIIQATPSLIASLSDEFIQNSILNKDSVLKVLAFGGEICPSRNKLRRWTSEGNETLLFNLYGLTEVSCWATCYKINLQNKNSDTAIPLGDSLTDTTLVIDDTGELHIGSQNRWCIINDEACPDKKKQILRPTGDIVCKTDDGVICFERRKDKIFKYKGKKISLQMINNILDDNPNISNYVVHYEYQSSRLLLFIVWNGNYCDIEKQRHELIINLRKTCSNIPPIELMSVPYIPLTSHGKSDYRKLLQYSNLDIENRNSDLINIESCDTLISNLWQEYTNHKSVTECSNFIMNGGDSISAIQFSLDLEWKFKLLVPDLVENILNSTFKDVVNLIKTCLRNNRNNVKRSCDTNVKTVSTVKKQCTDSDSYAKNLQCFKMVTRQGSVLRCSCSKNHLFASFIQKTTEPFQSEKEILNMIFKLDLKKCIDASPCVAYFLDSGKIVFFIGSHAGIFCCVNILEAKLEWQIVLPDRIESSACISTCGNFVFVGCYDHHLYCFDVKQGNLVWKFSTEAEIKSSPTVSQQNVVYVGSHDKNVYAIEKNGKMMWKTKVANGSLFSSPTLMEELCAVCVATLDGVLALLKMDSGVVMWSYNYGKPLFSSPRIFSELVYIGSTDEHLLCLNLSGSLKSRFKTKGPIFSMAACSSSLLNIIFGCHDGNVYCIDENNKLVWIFCCDSPVYATPFTFIYKEKHYVAVASSSGILYILQQSNGEVIFSHKCPGEIFSSPVVIDNFVIIGCRDNYVYCFTL